MSDYQGNIIIKTPATPTGPVATGRAPGMWNLKEVAYWVKQGVWPKADIIPDPYFNNVALLLSTTSLSNANNNLFVDSSGAFNPVSRNGNVSQGSLVPYSTNWSNYFDGAGDYLSIPYTFSNFEWWSTDFTIEAWVYPTNLSTWSESRGFPVMIGNVAPDGETNYWSFGPISDGRVRLYYYNGSPNQITSTATISANTWSHIAMTKTASGVTIFINGVAGNVTGISGTPQSSEAYPLIIGRDYGVTASGYISNLRVVRGTAVYTGNFTPPTSALTAIANTKLLTCQSSRFRDASTNNLTITVAGNPSVQDFSPFPPTSYTPIAYNQSDITNWSGYFDGSGDYLTLPSNAALEISSGDFTVEAWVHKASNGNYQSIYSNWNDSNSGGVLFCMNGLTPALLWRPNDLANPLVTGPAVRENSWTHIALVRNGNVFTIYTNGIAGTPVTYSTNATAAQPYQVGAYSAGAGGNFNGYLSNVRVVKGTAVYTGNFTPPTTNLTAISGTSLLTLQNAAFTDNSTNNFVITQNGNVTVTGNSPFNTVGYWSNYFDGSQDWIDAPNNPGFDQTGAFTVEMWIYITGTNALNYTFLYSQTVSNFFCLVIDEFGKIGIDKLDSGVVIRSASAVPQFAWTHIAMVSNGSNISLYVNGVSQGSTSVGTTVTSTRVVRIGALQGSGAYGLIGFISNVRVATSAVYTSNFTVPNIPLTAITNTVLLTCQNGNFKDNSTNNFTLTVGGNTSTQSFDPFYTSTTSSNGGSMYFDGSGDFLALQSNPSYALGSGDFRLEVWVYPITQGGHGSSNNDCIIDFRPGSNGAYGTLYSLNNGASINWYVNFNVRITGAAIQNNAWSHLCVSRVSGNTRLFINGVQSGSTYVDSTNYLQTNPWIGQFNDSVGSGWFNGYMSGMRIVKGSGVSSNFTPPTAPYSPTPNTTLLLNGMNAGIYDAAANNDIETVGNAQVSTVQSKFGGSSMYFDGNGDGILTTNSAIAYSPGNFTWECWVNFNSLSGNPCILSITSAPDRTLLYFNASTGINFVINRSVTDHVTVAQGSTSGWSTGVWYHIAVVRNGTSYNVYRNGVSVASTTSSYAEPNLNAPIAVGYSNYSASYLYFNGYIDDVRITNGVARYTANFTPPDKAFPTY